MAYTARLLPVMPLNLGMRQFILTFGENVAMDKVTNKQALVSKSTGTIMKAASALAAGGSFQKAAITVDNDKDITFLFWLGGATNWLKKPGSHWDYFDLIKTGIPKSSIDKLAAHIGMSRKKISEEIFDISVKTLERKAPKEKLGKKISSHAVEMALVLQHAYEVFGDEQKVKRWINRENKALNDYSPVQLFDTGTGLNLVNDVLTRIEEGVYS